MKHSLFLITALSLLTLMTIQSIAYASVPNDTDLKRLDIEKAIESNAGVNLSKYGYSIKYILLDDSDFLLPHHPRMKVLHSGNDIITLSHTGGNACAQFFTTNGKYLKSFIAQGRSGKEYVNLGGTAISDDGNLIALLDYNKILIYTSEGEYVKSIPVDFPKIRNNKGIAFIGNNKIFIAKENSYTFEHYGFTFDINGNLLHKQKISDSHFLKKEYDKAMSTERLKTADQIYIDSGKEIDIVSQLTDTLYAITPELKKQAWAYMDFGKYRGKNPKETLLDLNGASVVTTDYTGCNEFIFFKVMLMPKSSTLSKYERITYILLDKESGQVHSMKYKTSLKCWGMKNDLDNGAPFLPSSIVDNKMYQIVDAITFMELAEKSNSQKMKEVAASLTEESNPVIIEVQLKQ